MADLNLKRFDKLYPMIIHKYKDLIPSNDATIMDKLNSIVEYLNKVGKLTNDVVKDWNVVYNWAMNDGLTSNVVDKLNAMATDGTLSGLININILNQKANIADLNITNANVTSNTNAIASNLTKINSNTSAITSLGSGSPKAVYSTLSALQSAFPTGNTNIYLVSADGNWYYWNSSSWTAGGVYQSYGLPSNAGDQLVQSYNLCDYSKLTQNFYLGANGSPVSATNQAYSDYIPVIAGNTYCWYGAFSISYQATAYDINKNFIRSIFTTDLGGAYHAYTYTVPVGTAYIRFNMGVTQANTMVVQGTTYPSVYTTYGLTLTSSSLSTGIKNSLNLGVLYTDSNYNTSVGQNNLVNKNNTQYATAIGYGALKNNTTDGTQDSGLYNVAVGYNALQNNTIGNHNTAVGFQCMNAVTTGTGNTAIGEDSLFTETTGTGNTAVGQRAIQNSIGGQNNTAVGVSAMYWDSSSNVTGVDNTAIGHFAGSRTSSDTDLTFVGHFANKDLTSNSYSDSTALGANAIVNKSHQVMLGSPNVTVVDTYGDYESLTNGKGLILRSPSGNKFKLTISDTGVLTINPA